MENCSQRIERFQSRTRILSTILIFYFIATHTFFLSDKKTKYFYKKKKKKCRHACIGLPFENQNLIHPSVININNYGNIIILILICNIILIKRLHE